MNQPKIHRIFVIFSSLSFSLTGFCSATNIQNFDFGSKINVEPASFIESATITIPGSNSKPLNVNIKGGEYKINNGSWVHSNGTIEGGNTIAVRLMSSERANDVALCQIVIGDQTLYFKVTTKDFPMPDKIDGARNKNLGISGPNNAAIGGLSPVLLKYNKNPSSLAVQNKLIPDIKPLIDAQIRDAVICLGGDGKYYLTGSTGNDIWHANDGVELWRSDDLVKWDYMGLVWTFEIDGTWQKPWRYHNKAVRALWAPEIHYVKGNFYITLSMPPGDRGLLKSASGKPEGPYINALANDGYWKDDIDASLFEDEDGKVYLIFGGGWLARMKDDMSGLAEEPVKPILLNPDLNPNHHASTCPPRRNCQDIGREGAFMFKQNGKYYLTAADTYEGRYSSMVAISDNIYGPYKWRHEAVPCGGGTSYFKDKQGRWWYTYFGNDDQSPFREMPAMVMVDFDKEGKVFIANNQPFLKWAK